MQDVWPCSPCQYTVDKGLRGRNVLHQLLLILLCICSRSVRPLCVVDVCVLLLVFTFIPLKMVDFVTKVKQM